MISLTFHVSCLLEPVVRRLVDQRNITRDQEGILRPKCLGRKRLPSPTAEMEEMFEFTPEQLQRLFFDQMEKVYYADGFNTGKTDDTIHREILLVQARAREAFLQLPADLQLQIGRLPVVCPRGWSLMSGDPQTFAGLLAFTFHVRIQSWKWQCLFINTVLAYN